MIRNSALEIKIRPAKLDDAKQIAQLQGISGSNFPSPQSSPDKIRIAIGNSFLNKNSYFVVEEHGMLIGVIEQIKQNNSHIMLSYPYVSVEHPNREDVQMELIRMMLDQLKDLGYQYVSTQVTTKMDDAYQLFSIAGFDQEQTIFQSYVGDILPKPEQIDPRLEMKQIDFRRVKIKDAELVYNWIKRQLNPMSPIFITEDHFKHLLHAPKKRRDGWSMMVDRETREPLAMVSSIADEANDEVVIFGPFNPEGNEKYRLDLFNELLWYHRMKGYSRFRLMRIELFDNDRDLLDTFDMIQYQKVKLLTKTLR